MGAWLEASTHTLFTAKILRFGFSDGRSDDVGAVSGEGGIQNLIYQNLIYQNLVCSKEPLPDCGRAAIHQRKTFKLKTVWQVKLIVIQARVTEHNLPSIQDSNDIPDLTL